MLVTLSQVALGGAIGSVLRFAVTLVAPAPLGTLAVNVFGSLAIGALFAASRHSPFLMTGVLGGFTTFSAFSLDTLKLWQAGQPLQAAAYGAASVFLSLIAVALGAALAKGALS